MIHISYVVPRPNVGGISYCFAQLSDSSIDGSADLRFLVVRHYSYEMTEL